MADLASPRSTGGGGMAMPSTGDYVDLHELAKGWKAAIARAKDPATRFVCMLTSYEVSTSFLYPYLLFIRYIHVDTKLGLKMIVVTYHFIQRHLFEHHLRWQKLC